MQDAWRAYLELALGLTEASRRKAEKVARDLLDRGGATAGQVQSVVEDLVSTSRANREELAKLVRYEVDRALGVVGLATVEEVAHLTDRVQRLERQLREIGAPVAGRLPEPGSPAKPAAKAPAKPAAKAPVKKTAVKKTVKKAVVKKTAAKRATAKPPAGGRGAATGAADE